MLRGEGIGQRAVQPGADGAAVEGQHAILRKPLRQEIGQLGNTGLAGAHQVDTAARQLPLRLKEVAAVCPQGGLIRQDHQRAGRAGEAGEVFARLEVVANILRGVKIIGQDKVGGRGGTAHGAAGRYGQGWSCIYHTFPYLGRVYHIFRRWEMVFSPLPGVTGKETNLTGEVGYSIIQYYHAVRVNSDGRRQD